MVLVHNPIDWTVFVYEPMEEEDKLFVYVIEYNQRWLWFFNIPTFENSLLEGEK